MTIGSLFSGIGGLELGLESLGLGPVRWQCDSDPCARAVLSAHWPGVRIYDDVRDINARTERVDIVCGGFPCQPVSQAGRRKAQKDTRWLWPHFASVIDVVRPGIVFIENVPGLRSAGLRDVLGDLAALGFDAEWDRFSAAEVGAPHRRIRLFVLAYARRESRRLQSWWWSWAGGTDSVSIASDGDAGANSDASGEPEREPDSYGAAAVNSQGTREAPAGDDARQRSHVDGEGQLQPGGSLGASFGRAGDGNGWDPQPVLAGGNHGIPRRLDRERLLGNACVPQTAALAFMMLARRAFHGRRRWTLEPVRHCARCGSAGASYCATHLTHYCDPCHVAVRAARKEGES